MHVVRALKRLASRGPSPWPVLSVYVNTRPVGPLMTTYRPLLKKRMAEELAPFPQRSPERESLVVDFARVQHYLDYDLRPETRAAAVFSSYAADDTFDAVQLPLEFPEPLVVVGSQPTLYPLLVVMDRESRAVALVADGRTARLFVVSLGAVVMRREVRAAGTEITAAGQPAPRFTTDAAQALADLATQETASHVLLGGDPTVVAAIRAALPAPWGERVLPAGDWDPRIAEEPLAADVFARLEARRAEERAVDARGLVAAASAGDAALGVEKTRAALLDRTADRLLLGAAFADVATREELGGLALSRGARVLLVPADLVPAFDAAGVGAMRG